MASMVERPAENKFQEDKSKERYMIGEEVILKIMEMIGKEIEEMRKRKG